jgi:hypothetical protein
MLVVSSGLDQSVMLEKLDGFEARLKVTVLGVRGTKVRLGFEVVPMDPARPLEGAERLADRPPGSSANRGMESTQVWDWFEEGDVEAKQDTGQ